METVRALEGFPGLQEMQNYLASKKDVPLQTSELYSSKEDAKIIAPELRKSRFRSFQDDKLFGLVDQVIQWLNKSDNKYSYQLRRDDITETRYEQGGHFLKHKDFLSVTSNLIEEFTLLLCVTPSGLVPKPVGGETVIFPYASLLGQPFDTTTPGKGLLFRKDLDHAGALLEAGEKHILTANIWATRKQKSEQVLHVTFPNGDATGDDANSSAEEYLQRVANQDTSYALPVDCLKGTMLDGHVRFMNRGWEDKGLGEPPTVVTYECKDFTFEEFGTVAKILLNSYIDEESLMNHASAIDFFGPFSNENLLVNLAVEQKPVDPEASCKRFVKPTAVKGHQSPSKKKFKKVKGDDESYEDIDVIVCENESRTKVVSEVARLLGLDSYVPFKMVFVEGMVAQGYFERFKDVPVTPVALVVGDYNHVFGLQKFEKIQAKTLKDLHTKHYYDVDKQSGSPPLLPRTDGEDEDDSEEEEEDSDEERFEEEYVFFSKSRGLGLKVALGEGNARQELIKYVTHRNDEDMGDSLSVSMFLPFSRFSGDDDIGSDEEGDDTSMEPSTSLFHRDEKGMATFNTAEAAAAREFIAAMNLDECVKASLQKKRFELSQETQEYNDYYCNESTYANMSVLFVTGLVKLDKDAAEGKKVKAPVRFNVWPTEDEKKKRMTEARATFEYLGIDMPDMPASSRPRR